MSIKQKIKSLYSKLKRKSKTDSELGAEEVIEKEVYPPKKKCAKPATAKTTSACKNSANKKPSKRTRPTNCNYTMIDKDGESCDCGKS